MSIWRGSVSAALSGSLFPFLVNHPHLVADYHNGITLVASTGRALEAFSLPICEPLLQSMNAGPPGFINSNPFFNASLWLWFANLKISPPSAPLNPRKPAHCSWTHEQASARNQTQCASNHRPRSCALPNTRWHRTASGCCRWIPEVRRTCTLMESVL